MDHPYKLEVIREVHYNDLDVNHPTRLVVGLRTDDYSSERTDKRPSEVYKVIGAHGEVFVFEFHEGCNPNIKLNGPLLEDVVAICIDRMAQHQSGPFACRENALALTKMEEALLWMHARRRNRKLAGTSGTQKV